MPLAALMEPSFPHSEFHACRMGRDASRPGLHCRRNCTICARRARQSQEKRPHERCNIVLMRYRRPDNISGAALSALCGSRLLYLRAKHQCILPTVAKTHQGQNSSNKNITFQRYRLERSSNRVHGRSVMAEIQDNPKHIYYYYSSYTVKSVSSYLLFRYAVPLLLFTCVSILRYGLGSHS